MSRLSCRGRRLVSAVLPLLVGLCAPSPSAAADPSAARPRWRRVYLDDAVAGMALRDALADAARRLENDRCRSVLSAPDFVDVSGRPLSEKLASLGMAPAEYLEIVVFQDGTAAKRCRETALAFTEPGSRIVYICSQRFRSEWRANSRYARATVIHETLHTLGLGENPPSSQAISETVFSYCYR
jgi:hypothetical protein